MEGNFILIKYPYNKMIINEQNLKINWIVNWMLMQFTYFWLFQFFEIRFYFCFPLFQ